MATVQIEKDARKWTIVSGPSKFDFIEALSFRKQPTQLVKFKIQKEKGKRIEEVCAQIFLISRYVTADDGHEDDEGHTEGHDWKFVATLQDYGTEYNTEEELQSESLCVIGHYSTKTRTGYITELVSGGDVYLTIWKLFL